MSGTTSLTQMQLLGVGSETNVAEGYPMFEPTPSQATILARLGDLMQEARRTPYPELEVRAHTAFLHALGQQSAPVGSGRIISFYASTVAIDVAAAALARRVKTVGLVHPVIDCIPALLRARGLTLVPLSERETRVVVLLDESLDRVTALFGAPPRNAATERSAGAAPAVLGEDGD